MSNLQSSDNDPMLVGHEYDGIREFDNPTPGWWHAIFIGTVVFAVLYFVFFEFSPMAWTPQSTWESRQVAYYQEIFGQIGELEPDEKTIVEMMHNDKMLAVARGIFGGACAACHGKDAGGLPASGVNLTDEQYKNVKQLTDIYATITKGAAAGAMPSWENRLGENERIILAAYVASLRGTNTPGGQPPAGETIPPWPKQAE